MNTSDLWAFFKESQPQMAKDVEERFKQTSKLRAPVADESPMAKMADALREKGRQEQQAYQDRRNQATEWGPMPEGTEADNPTSSAPVAGEYTSAMGEAAEAYLNSFPYAHKLPAQFRWADLWAAMSGAAPQASEAVRPCTCQPDWGAKK